MDQVFSLKFFFKENRKSQEFCQSGKVGTMQDQVHEKRQLADDGSYE